MIQFRCPSCNTAIEVASEKNSYFNAECPIRSCKADLNYYVNSNENCEPLDILQKIGLRKFIKSISAVIAINVRQPNIRIFILQLQGIGSLALLFKNGIFVLEIFAKIHERRGFEFAVPDFSWLPSAYQEYRAWEHLALWNKTFEMPQLPIPKINYPISDYRWLSANEIYEYPRKVKPNTIATALGYACLLFPPKSKK